MTPELEAKLKACPNLPSPPAVAIQIIQLANKPEIHLKRIIKLLNSDPALSSKILRIANSPLYPYPKKIESLHQALMVLGLNATISLALSFSLIKSLKTTKGGGLDYALYWKRALVAGTASRALGKICKVAEIEELYLAGLLQDIGMLTLDLVFPDLYASHKSPQTDHARLRSYENQVLGITHGAVGSWLLTQWNFPDRLRLAVGGSDDPSRIPTHDERATFASCVALSGGIAEIFLRETSDEYIHDLKTQAQSLLGLSPESLLEVLENIKDQLPEIERLLEKDLQPWNDPQTILEQARESLLIRSLQAIKQVEELQISNATMADEFENLEENHRHDALTGALTRAHLDKCLTSAFEQAIENQECLTLVFGDLDKFKSVNDTYGHQAGDVVLQSAVRLLMLKLRGTDLVGRYGGEEFVLILPKAPQQPAEMVCERILKAFRETTHETSSGHSITVTISLGIATHTPEQPYSTISDLLQDADEAVYYSKAHGGNRFTTSSFIQTEQLA
ncbi:MAG: GGDEF domain-containing protein [Nitrospirota bacterium]|nr:GGDEF domain-containing protein [Nitrospirota bacterium]